MKSPLKLSSFKIFLFELFDLIAYIIFVAGVVFFIRFFIINPFNVVGSSMFPTIHESDFILVDKISQRIKPYQRWDIIVFVPPGKDTPYVKRIIWLSWETITIKENTVVACKTNTEDCQTLDQSFLSGVVTSANCWRDTFIVDDGFFVLGDNRWASTDSRCCFWLQCFTGSNYLVPDDHIIGKVFVRVYPSPSLFVNPYE